MSLYDTREIGKVKIVMLKGTDGANSYNAGAGINLVGNTFVNAQRGARCGIIDSITSGYAHTTILLSGNESIKAGEVFILKSETSGTIDHLRIQYTTTASNVYNYWLYDTDGTTQKSIDIDNGTLLFITLDETGYKAIIIDAVSSSDSLAGLGIGKMTSYTDNVVDTDIDLHRAPQIGDRILLYCNSAVSNPTSLKTYNDGTAVSSNVDMISPLNYVKGWNILEYKNQIGNRWTLKQSIKTLPYTAGIGIGINDTTITNTNPQLGTDCAYKKFDSEIYDGNLGTLNGYAKNLVLDFRASATTTTNFNCVLQSGTTSVINKNAVLKDRDGNLFTRDIYGGMVLYCESNVSGSGTAADPVVITVIEVSNWYVETGRSGYSTIGKMSTAEGAANIASNDYAHAEGYQNTASGTSSHAEGWGNTASGSNAHAEGAGNTADGVNSHAEGENNTIGSFAYQAHAEGYGTTVNGQAAHAEGIDTMASGEAAHAEGENTIASGKYSHASGYETVANHDYQAAFGKYNEALDDTLFEIGNGTGANARSNALEVKSNGNLTASGTITDGEGNTLTTLGDIGLSVVNGMLCMTYNN